VGLRAGRDTEAREKLFALADDRIPVVQSLVKRGTYNYHWVLKSENISSLSKFADNTF
jgi:hypothetical protein